MRLSKNLRFSASLSRLHTSAKDKGCCLYRRRWYNSVKKDRERQKAMAFNRIRKVPTAEEIKRELPMPAELAAVKQRRDDELRAVFSGGSAVLCSSSGALRTARAGAGIFKAAGRAAAARGGRAAAGAAHLYQRRAPPAKVRAWCTSLTRKAADLGTGIKAIRRLHIKALAEFGLPAATRCCIPRTSAPFRRVGYHAGRALGGEPAAPADRERQRAGGHEEPDQHTFR